MDADQIANSRPPDRIHYGEWDFDPESQTVTKELVAVEWTVFKVTKYEEREVIRYTRMRRKVTEVWRQGPTSRPVIKDGYDGNDVNITLAYDPGSTVARWHWEYRSAGQWNDGY